MNDLVAGALRWTLRLVVLAAGALLFIGLLATGALLALVWLARALWARLTGRPLAPWNLRMMHPRHGWSTVYRSTARWTAPKTARSRVIDVTNVTDVIAREVQ